MQALDLSIEFRSAAALLLPGSLRWDRQVTQAEIHNFGALNNLHEVFTCLHALKMEPKATILLKEVPQLGGSEKNRHLILPKPEGA